MKISINIFDVGELELHVERDAGDGLGLTKAFYTFLERPWRPHLSFFTDPKPGRSYLEPHFTAGRRSPREFRKPLAQVDHEAFRDGLGKFAETALRRYFSDIRPADLGVLEGEGWTVHYLDWRAVRRWLRRGPPWRLDRHAAASLTHHLLRHAVQPGILDGLDLMYPWRFAALRLGEDGELQARFLMRFPHDVPLSGLAIADTFPATLAAGWYSMDAPRGTARTWEFSDVVPAADLEAIGAQIRSLLVRYPLRPARSPVVADDTDHPKVLSFVFGLYIAEMLDCIASLKEERLLKPDAPPSGRRHDEQRRPERP